MEIKVKMNTEESINSSETDGLERIYKELIMGYNGWQSILKKLNESKEFKERYEEEMAEMRKSGNCGMSSCICSVLEEMFYELESYIKGDLEPSEVEDLKSENRELRQKVRVLDKKIEELKNILG